MAEFLKNNTSQTLSEFNNTEKQESNNTSQTLPEFNNTEKQEFNDTPVRRQRRRRSSIILSDETLKEMKEEIFTGANVIIILSTVFVFILIQTLFFHFIASKQFNEVLKDKVEILNIYKSAEPQTAELIKNTLESESTKETIRIGKEQEIIRTNENINLILIHIGMLMGGLVLLICAIAIKMFRQKGKDGSWFSFSKTDLILTSLILTGYTTELAFFFGVIRQYKFYGDHNIIYGIYKNVQTRINKSNNVLEYGKTLL